MSQTQKPAPPDALFARFLQRQAKSPTPKQLNVWENDGGNTQNDKEAFAIINGFVCHNRPQKLIAYMTKYWRWIRMQIFSKMHSHPVT